VEFWNKSNAAALLRSAHRVDDGKTLHMAYSPMRYETVSNDFDKRKPQGNSGGFFIGMMQGLCNGVY
jgi:hypothetical protein